MTLAKLKELDTCTHDIELFKRYWSSGIELSEVLEDMKNYEGDDYWGYFRPYYTLLMSLLSLKNRKTYALYAAILIQPILYTKQNYIIVDDILRKTLKQAHYSVKYSTRDMIDYMQDTITSLHGRINIKRNCPRDLADTVLMAVRSTKGAVLAVCYETIYSALDALNYAAMAQDNFIDYLSQHNKIPTRSIKSIKKKILMFGINLVRAN
jgi:hypothetical protein